MTLGGEGNGPENQGASQGNERGYVSPDGLMLGNAIGSSRSGERAGISCDLPL